MACNHTSEQPVEHSAELRQCILFARSSGLHRRRQRGHGFPAADPCTNASGCISYKPWEGEVLWLRLHSGRGGNVVEAVGMSVASATARGKKSRELCTFALLGLLSLSSCSTTTDSDFESVHVEKAGGHSPTCLEAPGNSQGISPFAQEFTPLMENSFGNPPDYHGSPTSLVPLTIPTSPTDHHTRSAANAVPAGSPSTSHTPSTAYPSPLSATNPSFASHAPQTAHLGHRKVSVSPASSSTTLHAPTTHPPTSTTTPPSPERKRGRPKGSVKSKPVTYGPHPRLGWPPGTGYKQRLRASLGEDAAQAAKRPRGRPQKQDSSPVSVEFGKMMVSGTPSRHEGPSFQAPRALLHGPGSSVPPTPSLLSDTAISLPSQTAAAASRTTIQLPDAFLSTPAPGPRLLDARCTIIPDEDPQRDVETPDHDGEDSEGLEEELGAEDDPQDDDDEANEDLDEPETPPSSSRPRQPLPVWLMDQFNARREELKGHDANGLPPLYSDNETFWFPQKSTFFFLQQQSCSPPQLYNPRFFLWDPECLCNRIPCPNLIVSIQERRKEQSHFEAGIPASFLFFLQLSQLNSLHILLIVHLALRKSSLDSWTGRKYEAFLSFDDAGPRGRHGYIPSPRWFWDVYDGYTEKHQHDFNQHTAMLPADVTKHVARVEGEQVFTALLTVTNHTAQIRACDFVATKSHSQFELALNRMRESLELFGHCQPSAFYTDMPTDRGFLEKCFPSLQENVFPVEKYGDLDVFELPSSTQLSILPKNTAQSINDADLTQIFKENMLLSSWHIKIVYIIFRLGRIWQNESFLISSSFFFSTPKFSKQVGWSLQTFYTFNKLVVQLSLLLRCVISNISKTSLPDLCALVLHKRFLNKKLSEQLQHAAQGAYASLCIYEKLAKITVLQPLPTAINPSLPVLLYSTDNTTVIAQGIISQHLDDHSFDGFTITPTRTVIDISKVLVPGAILTTHGRRSLKSFGKTPFSVVCLRSHLRLIDPTVTLEESGSLQSAIQPEVVSEDYSHSESVELSSGDSEELEGESTVSLAPLLSQDLSGPFIDPSSDRDPASLSLGCEILGTDPETWDYTIYSCVLKDPWHVFHMFQISATHGLRKQFTRELRDAIFIPDSADRAQIDSWGAIQSPPRTYMSLRNSSSEWLRQQCKHIIPTPHILYPLVAKVFRTYGPIVDPDSQKPLFSSDNWKTAKNVLELIKNGYLSDPPGVALYTAIGIDKKAGGLPIYRCARGTNSTEGGVHAHICSRLPKFGTSIRHLQASLLDFVLRHNLLTGTYNSTGQRYRGHYSIWITNSIQEHLISLQDTLVDPIQISGWVNGNLYTPTTEVLGILPIPDIVRTSSGMAIPTSGEPKWQEAVKVWNATSDQTTEIYYKLTEQLKVYYTKWKALSHVKETLSLTADVKETLSLTADVRRPLSLLIHDPHRSKMAPEVPVHTQPPLTIEKGLLEFSSMQSQTVKGPMDIDPQLEHSDAQVAGPSSSNFQMHTETLSRTRVQGTIANVNPAPTRRKRQTCCKCAVIDCPGSQKVSNYLTVPFVQSNPQTPVSGPGGLDDNSSLAMTIVLLNHDRLRFWIDISFLVPLLMQPTSEQITNGFGNPSDYCGTPTSVVLLTIPTSPADHHMLSAAKAVPPGSPSASHTPSMAYPSPLSATTPSATSHTPQTAHLGPCEVAVSSASSSTALYTPTTDPPTSTTTPPLAEHKRSHSKGSDSSPVSVDFGKMLVSGTPSQHEGPSFQAPCCQKYQMHGSCQPSNTNQMLIVIVVIVGPRQPHNLPQKNHVDNTMMRDDEDGLARQWTCHDVQTVMMHVVVTVHINPEYLLNDHFF
ncbi:uncharacterized protein LACBIDRAFT_324541 [Laccaria bicolor S238N-H82]|uniref:Predicted protein n=1 Tax=Laccaria bicolor (strain S238N-H82 / ATCC MYA-4686) TaxID=486041 RepID=B0D287_LACBS|nr:uncharacterized protein LACBIDRAFT_324541 [Laccaria bicolor S238N-H82]EDR10701.1 predicted protein [Laccaria bicolor S238N-H82]|eukprot:XP_001878002.1 predicted protein [Laccaria bicolor S238N-H82]